MESLDAHLRVVKMKFPGQNARIEELYESDEDFRSLCQDYLLCLQHLQKFMEKLNERNDVVSEYRTMRVELEKELYEIIYKH